MKHSRSPHFLRELDRGRRRWSLPGPGLALASIGWSWRRFCGRIRRERPIPSVIVKGVVRVDIAVARRLIPIPGAPGPRAPGGLAFTCPVPSSLTEGRGYVLVDDDGSRKEVEVGEYSYSDRRAHGLAYYLDSSEFVPGT